MIPITPIANSPEIVQQADMLQQANSVVQKSENSDVIETSQGITSTISNQVECQQTVTDFLKENYPNISPEELAIYKNADLKVEMVGDRGCLTQPDIDLDYKDANGMTNLERIENGLAPINPKDGLPYELHHIGQKNDAPLAELTHFEHMSPETNKILHPQRSGSEVNHGFSWRDIREDHWQARAEQLKQQYNYGV